MLKMACFRRYKRETLLVCLTLLIVLTQRKKSDREKLISLLAWGWFFAMFEYLVRCKRTLRIFWAKNL